MEKSIQNMLQNSSTMYYVQIDFSSNIVYANRHFNKDFSIHSNINQHNFIEKFNKSDHDKYFQTLAHCISSPHTTFSVSLRKSKSFSQTHWIKWEFIALDKEVMCIGFDITNIDALENILDSISDSFFIIDKDFKILQTNSVFEQKMKKSKNELLGKEIWNFLPPNTHKKIVQRLTKAMQENKGDIFEAKVCDRWFSMKVNPIENALVIYASDIHDKKIAELKLLNQNEQLKEIAFLQSHKVRGPVASVLGLINLLHEIDCKHEEVCTYIKHLSTATQELDNIIHNVARKIDLLNQD